MCTALGHRCSVCNEYYECNLPGWLCPSVNDDEDGFMCPDCLADWEDEYAYFYNQS